MRKKYLYKKCFHIKEINENTILFFDNSLEDIRKLYNMRRISISKYLNSIYYFFVIKVQLIIDQYLKIKKLFKIILQILHLAEIYGLLFFVNLPIGLISFVCFLQDRQNIIIYKYIILIRF